MYFHREGRYWRRRRYISVVSDDDVKACVRRDVDVLSPRGPAAEVYYRRIHDGIFCFFSENIDAHIGAQSLQPNGFQGHDETVWNCDDHSTP